MRNTHTKLSRLLPVLSATVFLGGCNMVALGAKGQVGTSEKSLIVRATWLMLLVVVPIIVMTLAFAWKHRAINPRIRCEPEWPPSYKPSYKLRALVWAIPCVVIFCLAVIAWSSSHDGSICEDHERSLYPCHDADRSSPTLLPEHEPVVRTAL
jgi:cytochrome o ubiquinol oxidase subunit 2